MEIPIALANGARSIFATPIVPGSELPALLGLELITMHSTIVGVKNMKLILPGPGGYRMVLSPGSTALTMERARSGHFMLPCTEWAKSKPGAPMIMMGPKPGSK